MKQQQPLLVDGVFDELPYDSEWVAITIGGGPNGPAAAAYLSKCGLSVCVLEERYEAGGCYESAEPQAGIRIRNVKETG